MGKAIDDSVFLVPVMDMPYEEGLPIWAVDRNGLSKNKHLAVTKGLAPDLWLYLGYVRADFAIIQYWWEQSSPPSPFRGCCPLLKHASLEPPDRGC